VTSIELIAERLEELEKKFAIAERERDESKRERDEYRALYLEMMERCRKLELGILGSKSEHLSDNGAQLSLDVLSMVLSEYLNPIPSEVMAFQIQLAAGEASSIEFVPAVFRRKP